MTRRDLKKKLRLITLIYPQSGSEDGFLPPQIECLKHAFDIEIFPSFTTDATLHQLEPEVNVNFGLANFSRNLLVRAVFSLVALLILAGIRPREPRHNWHFREISELRDTLIGRFYFSRLVGSRDVDAVYSWWSYGLGVGAALGHDIKIPQFIGLRGDDFQDFRAPNKPYSHLLYAIREMHDLKFVSGSDFAAGEMVRLYGILETSVATVHLTTANPTPQEQIISEIDCFRTASSSNGAEVKRLGLMVETLIQVAREYPAISFSHLHIGDLGVAHELLDSMPPNLNIEQTGWLPHAKVLEELGRGAFRAFLHFSEYEGGVPVSMIEAASHGLPLVGFQAGGVPEICDSGTGLLIERNLGGSEISRLVGVFFAQIREGSFHSNSRDRWEEAFSTSTRCRILDVVVPK